ncbi:unnamed protein product [Arctia plantaginis]|uniref:Uncharacterized protein n=1 Tax=Arctia plantaginis TaxID=874455 RepID=A0A8S1BEY1_ARCPL|nr:unnamed protein product [Arctia plantaginis]
MSKSNPETAFGELSKKVAALTLKISNQSTLIEAQNKKIEDQQLTIDKNSTIINNLVKVVGELVSKIDKLVTSKGGSEMEVPIEIQADQSGRETTSASDPGISLNNPQRTVRTRRMAAAERTKLKDASSLCNNTVENKLSSQLLLVEKKQVDTDDDWKVVNRKKNKLASKIILKGENPQISSFQAVEQKKYMHVWSLHPDTSVV